MIFVLFALSGCTGFGINNAETEDVFIDKPVDENTGDLFPETPVPPLDEEQENKKKYLKANTSSLRIRSGAGSSYSVVGYLDKNDMLIISEKVGDYYKTKYKEKPAFVHADYVSIVEVEPSTLAVENAIDFGMSLLGYPYVWGSQRYHWGNGKLNSNFKNGEFDCSAFVQYIYYKTNGVILDVTSRGQSLNGKPVERANLKRGDLMFFTNASRYNKTGVERVGHVGIYFGDGYILHTASDHAVLEPISSLRWSYYLSARRVV